MERSKKGLLITLAVVLILAISAVALWLVPGTGSGQPGVPIRLPVEVIHKDGSRREFVNKMKRKFAPFLLCLS